MLNHNDLFVKTILRNRKYSYKLKKKAKKIEPNIIFFCGKLKIITKIFYN